MPELQDQMVLATQPEPFIAAMQQPVKLSGAIPTRTIRADIIGAEESYVRKLSSLPATMANS